MAGGKPTEEGRASAGRRWAGIVRWFALFGLAASAAGLAIGLAAKLLVVLAAGYRPMLPLVVGNWRTVLLGALLVALAAVRGHRDFPSIRRIREQGRRWVVALAAAVAFLAARAPDPSANRLGWFAGLQSKSYWIDVGHPHRPPALVHTNRLGFRDEEWTPEPPPGTLRVVVVGDSYVFGAGVPDEAGLVDRRLEEALGALRPGRWEVINAGVPGWGVLTYLQVARALVRAARPRAVVIGFLGASDWDLLEPNQVLQMLGPTGYRALGALGVVEDLRDASLLAAPREWREGDEALAGAARVEEAARALLAEADAAGTEVVLWEYYEPFPWWNRLEGTPRFRRAGWPEGFDRRWEGWGNDPVLAIPGDGHPTSEGNRRMAEALAPVIVRALGATPPFGPAGEAR